MANNPRVVRVATFRLLKPPPCGVVIGAFKKTLFFLIESHDALAIPVEIPFRKTFFFHSLLTLLELLDNFLLRIPYLQQMAWVAVIEYKAPKGFFNFLWANHAVHHYKDQTKAYGVSSPFWDYVFGTMPK